ncbi:MAG: cysteine desulfurase [Lachnospiraceae bacterium]|nr:cysteine desulfurase [Lachnospiraceae bacterium]
MEIYLDNSATTKCFEEVGQLMTRIMCDDYGNPSSLHMKGVQAEGWLCYAKEILAGILKVKEREIFFTSGGTEADNLALVGSALGNNRRGNHLVTTAIEHPAVMQTMQYLETQGFRVTYLPVDDYGRISLEDLRKAITKETILVSIMHTNNEIGSLQPVAEAGLLIKQLNPRTLFHVDGVQGFGKFRIYPKKLHIDLLSVSGHKIHGPKGIGLLYVNERTRMKPLLFGGGQQGNLRPGTENVPGAAGLAKAAELCYASLDKDVERLYQLRKSFTDGVSRIDSVWVNGLPERESAPHVVSVSVAGIRSEVLLHALEDKGIYVSAGSACSARRPQPSATLKAIGLKKELLDSTLRFSFSIFTTQEEIKYTLQAMNEIIPMLRRYTRR